MPGLDCCIVTFNCGRALVDPRRLANHLHSALSPETLAPPDILVLALEEVAPIAYSFVGGYYLAPYLRRFAQAVNDLAQLWETAGYTPVASINAGMTALLVFAKPDAAQNITGIESGSVRVGDYELGNKGAVALRLHYQADSGSTPTQFTFLSAHLAPSEGNCRRRNKDWQTIVENLLFEHSQGHTGQRSTVGDGNDTEEDAPLLSGSSTSPSHAGLYSPHSHLFVAGDLNYRTSDSPPSASDARAWPQPNDESDRPAAAFKALWAKDQLTRELRAGKTLQHFQEADITFAPTYKYSDDAQQRAASLDSASAAAEKTWASHRTPSWCDRILYRPISAGLKVLAYDSLPLLPSSDHRPVFLRVSVPLGEGSGSEEVAEHAPYRLSADARARGPRSRAKEFTVGVAMLVALTWEGRLMLLGTVAGAVGGWALVRSLLWSSS